MSVGLIVVDSRDNVAVVTDFTRAGEGLRGVKGQEIHCLSDIPQYHKVAIRNIAEGEPVVKYGEHIGIATTAIRIGEHVHDHNLRPEED